MGRRGGLGVATGGAEEVIAQGADEGGVLVLYIQGRW